jgi:hypothetical protein
MTCANMPFRFYLLIWNTTHPGTKPRTQIQRGVKKKVPMQRHHGGFLADWTDENGHRHRRILKTAEEARRLQAKMRAEILTKKAARATRLLAAHAPSKATTRKTKTSATRRARSRSTAAAN